MQCLLVQGYPSGTSWGFPKGKLEEGETDIDAAVREVYEEIGFDIRHLIEENQYLDASVKDSVARMYIIPGVAENTVFEPKTRNEIRVSGGGCGCGCVLYGNTVGNWSVSSTCTIHTVTSTGAIVPSAVS